MKLFSEVVEELKNIISKEVKGKVYDRHVAEALGMTQSNFGTLKKRERIPFEELLNFCAVRRISVNYLLYGQSPESLVEVTNKVFMARFKAVNNTVAKSA